MESAAKRKAAAATAGESEGRPAKRQKVPAEANPNAETVESTTIAGLKFLDSLKAAKDKTGRPIADHFLTLPDKDEIPEYYEHVKLPMAIDTIEDKLNAGEYSSLAQVESDCKRLVNNAKQYNEKKSLVYEDAERLRKTASNWMTKNNPAYRDGNYVAVATPVPGEENGTPSRPTPRAAATPRVVSTPGTVSETVERPRRAAAAAAAQMATPVPSRLRNYVSSNLSNGKAGFSGKSFQQAQEQIVSDLIDHKENDLQIFLPFVNLPPRSLKDYYALIRDPMSLTAVHKKVRGVVGREQPTGHTLFKSWDALEQAMQMIWNNARIYNEDGSEIYSLSQELEEMFYEKLNDAKAHVSEPPQPKLKLNMSGGTTPAPKQQLKLKLRQSPGSESGTPGARSSATPGVIVDGDALQRQQRHVMDATHRPSRPSSSGKAGTPSATSNPFAGPRGASASIPPLPSRAAGSPALNGVKQDVQSPALSAVRPGSTAPDGQRLNIPNQAPPAVMAPPHATPRPASGSPLPNGVNGYATPYQAPTYYAPPQAPRVDCLRKTPLKNINEALIPKITLNTHPALNASKPWSSDIFAHKTKTAHSATIVVSPSHSYLQITPHVPIALTDRLYRLFVTVNGNRTLEVNRVPVTAGINGSSPGPGYESGKKKGEPVFEAKLHGGVNRIEVEIVAEKEKKEKEKEGASASASKKEEKEKEKDLVDVEKCTVFLNLMRQPSY